MFNILEIREPKQLISEINALAYQKISVKIDLFLKSDSSWDIIDHYLVSVLNTLPPWLKAYLHRPETINKIRIVIPYIIAKLKLRELLAENIKGQDTDEFEQMIMKISGENFAAIEMLGGVLGMFAGFAVKCLQFS